ncbi:N-acetylneuraminate synthase [Halodesulfovibrio sp.]|uniref:N-acetylneuraminate synthase n=1 Tax=Halodesulfovibrio sp. TaxID=1912772 RepID=UPI0025F88238|nr:N-acetylneuraminate synthase [Halodesulfovibrio sp.]MCT4626530.1 N-acetylneuraminate synthase [Halodesulfovibrio sp.]
MDSPILAQKKAPHTFVIAEAGVNHNGSEEFALRIIELAARAGADAVKFQTFKASKLVSKGTATAEYQKEQTGNSDQYTMLKKLELTDQLHEKIIQHCKAHDIEFMSTPFDIDSAHYLLSLGMERFKIPSGELTNIPFLRELAAFDKPMILSTGMATLEEVKEAVAAINEAREECGFVAPLESVLTVLHCTSNYPAPLEDVNLSAIHTMVRELPVPIGYSDHTAGILVPVAAVAMGATVIEKHFTLDKNLPGPDHQASLEPNELTEMVQQIRQIEISMGSGVKEPSAKELPVRELVRRSVTVVVDKAEGEILTKDDVELLRPGTGIPPKHLESIVGRRLKVAKNKGSVLLWQDLVDA